MPIVYEYGTVPHRTCAGVSRRDLLKVGALGLGGLTLPWWFARRAEAAAEDYVRDKSVVLLFLSGGASHIETFNPNMSGPAPARSATGEVATRLPGVTFGGTFPLLAAHAEKMSVVRNYRHPVGDHNQAIVHVLNGGQSNGDRDGDAPSIGSVVSRLRGANHPRTGMPTYTLLDSEEVDSQYATRSAACRSPPPPVRWARRAPPSPPADRDRPCGTFPSTSPATASTTAAICSIGSITSSGRSKATAHWKASTATPRRPSI